MNYKVKAIPKFEKEFKRLVKKFPSLKAEYIQLVQSLNLNPYQGTSLGNDCYKIRLAIASKGKGKSRLSKSDNLRKNYRSLSVPATHL